MLTNSTTKRESVISTDRAPNIKCSTKQYNIYWVLESVEILIIAFFPVVRDSI